LSAAAAEVEPLSTLALVTGGAIGGLAGFITAIALPYLRGVLEGKVVDRPSGAQIWAVIGIILFNMFMGGVAAFFVGEATLMRQAIAFGLAWPAVIKGAGEGLQLLAAAGDRPDPNKPDQTAGG
jgi:hypothetical protein